MAQKAKKVNELTVLPEVLYIWKEKDRDDVYYLTAESLDEIGDDATFVGKYEFVQGGNVKRSIEVDGIGGSTR